MTRKHTYLFDTQKDSQGCYQCHKVSEVVLGSQESEQATQEPSQQDYMANMRHQFEQMRQEMLDRMQSFTYVKNIRWP